MNQILRKSVENILVEGYNKAEWEWDESIEYQLSIECTEINNHINSITWFLDEVSTEKELVKGYLMGIFFSTWGVWDSDREFDFDDTANNLSKILKI